MALTAYRPGTTFPGRIGRTVGESEAAWPMPNRAKPGAPNMPDIVLDDTGYGQFGCYGSPINAPNLDRLAENGLRYTNMGTTALCSRSRSCMLNGRYSWGWTWAGNTPFRRWKREPTAVGRPTASSRTGPRVSPPKARTGISTRTSSRRSTGIACGLRGRHFRRHALAALRVRTDRGARSRRG